MKPNQRNQRVRFTAFLASFFILSLSAIAADKEGDPKPEGDAQKRDNPEAKAGPRDGEGGVRKGPRDGEGGAKKPEARRAGDKGVPDKGVPLNAKNSKEAKVFVAYDKNKDGTVNDEEIVAMLEGKQNSRGKREVRKAVDRADKDEDKVLNYDEFLWWYRIGRTDERARNR